MPDTPATKPSNAEVQKYLDGALKKLEENPQSLEPFERRLLAKIKKASQSAQQAAKDTLDLKNQIAQAEARLRSLELQAENHQGAVNAYIDEIVAVRFNLEEPTVEPVKVPEATSDTDGKGKKLKAVKGD